MARVEEGRTDLRRDRADVGIERKQIAGQVFYDSARILGDPFGTNDLVPDRTIIFVSDVLSVNVMVHSGVGGTRYYYGQVLDELLRIPIEGARVFVGEEHEGVVVTNDYGEFALSSSLPETGQVLRVVTDGGDVVCRIPPEGDSLPE